MEESAQKQLLVGADLPREGLLQPMRMTARDGMTLVELTIGIAVPPDHETAPTTPIVEPLMASPVARTAPAELPWGALFEFGPSAPRNIDAIPGTERFVAVSVGQSDRTDSVAR